MFKHAIEGKRREDKTQKHKYGSHIFAMPVENLQCASLIHVEGNSKRVPKHYEHHENNKH